MSRNDPRKSDIESATRGDQLWFKLLLLLESTNGLENVNYTWNKISGFRDPYRFDLKYWIQTKEEMRDQFGNHHGTEESRFYECYDVKFVPEKRYRDIKLQLQFKFSGIQFKGQILKRTKNHEIQV